MGLNASAKSIDSDQPAQSAQADLSQHFFAFGKFSTCHRTSLRHDSVSYFQKCLSTLSKTSPYFKVSVRQVC